MKREVKTETRPSIFTSRNNADVQFKDRYESVTVSAAEFHKYGGSRDKDGKMWHLNSIIADETGDYIRRPVFKI